jgi:hypothetical protein
VRRDREKREGDAFGKMRDEGRRMNRERRKVLPNGSIIRANGKIRKRKSPANTLRGDFHPSSFSLHP